jgi:hypothetical protein
MLAGAEPEVHAGKRMVFLPGLDQLIPFVQFAQVAGAAGQIGNRAALRERQVAEVPQGGALEQVMRHRFVSRHIRRGFSVAR